MKDASTIIGYIVGFMFIFVILAALGAFLVQIVLGYFGYDFTLWQSFVIAFTVSWLCKDSSSK